MPFIFSLTSGEQDDYKTGFSLIYEQDFEDNEAISGFVFSDPGPWFLTSGKEKGLALEFAGRGDYQPRVRSPLIIGLIDNLILGDFVLEADILQTGREYGHRDMCVFFGFQDSTRFYYVHMASSADQNAHNVFVVNDLPQTNIARETTDGIRWIDDNWHHVRLERLTENGSIKVYFDDMDTPIMVADDNTFQHGYIGFGSFDDSGKIDNIRIWAKDSKKMKVDFFKKKY